MENKEEELKTLKDCKDKEEARAEAIKWIKNQKCGKRFYMRRIVKIKTHPKYLIEGSETELSMAEIEENSMLVCCSKNVKCEKCWGIINWIKHFFNITEDDLK